MDFTKIISALETGVQFVEEFAPTVAALTPYGGLVDTATKAIEAVTETVENVQARVEEGAIVASSNDQAQVRDLAQRLHDANDVIAKQIDES